MTESTPSPKSKSILVVDDDDEVCEALTEFLIDAGYSVFCAGNGAQALELLTSTPVDTILLDLNMPVMNGYQFLSRRASDAGLAKIPVLIMSASPISMAAVQEGTAGVHVLAKPFDVTTMLGLLRRCSETVARDDYGNVMWVEPLNAQILPT